jgi:sialate O-acetylesterase
MVAAPVHFRYGWARNPLANLQVVGNKDIPFATQRSDGWLMEELPLGVLGDKVPDHRSREQRGRVLEKLRREELRRRVREAEMFLEENREAVARWRSAR